VTKKSAPPSVEELQAWLDNEHKKLRELVEESKAAKARLVSDKPLRRELVNEINNEIDTLEERTRQQRVLVEERKAALLKAVAVENEAQRRITPTEAAVRAFATGQESKLGKPRPADAAHVVGSFGRVTFLRCGDRTQIEADESDPEHFLGHAAACLSQALRGQDGVETARSTALFLPCITKLWARLQGYSVPEVQEYRLLSVGSLPGKMDDIVAVSELSRSRGTAEAA
jgi:hypothetical protein